MDKYIFILSPNELELMEYMWRTTASQTSITIGKFFPQWKNGYIHSLLKSLVQKDFLKIVGTQLIGTHYVKLYLPNITKEEFSARILASLSLDESSISQIALALCQVSTEYKMEAMINSLKETLNNFKSKEDSIN